MFGMGWTEMLVIGIVALIVVGPKDLPVLFRNIGRFVGKAKGMAREFSRAMNEAADEAGVADVTRTLKSATNPLNTAMSSVQKSMNAAVDLDPESETGKLAAERAENKKKIELSTAKTAAARKRREAEAAVKAAEEAEATAARMEKNASGTAGDNPEESA